MQLVDADNQPALTGSLLTDLSIGFQCSCDREGGCPTVGQDVYGHDVVQKDTLKWMA